MDKGTSREELEKIFNAIDRDGSGTISVNELKQVFHVLEFPLSDQQLQERLKTVDNDGSGDLDFGEFLTLIGIEETEDDDKVLMQVFDMIDSDGSGAINAVELKEAFTQLGEDLTLDETKQMIGKIDADGDGTINFQDELIFPCLVAQIIDDIECKCCLLTKFSHDRVYGSISTTFMAEFSKLMKMLSTK